MLDSVNIDNRSILRRFLDAILKLLGFTIDSKDTLYNKAIETLDEYFKSPKPVKFESESGINFIKIKGFTRSKQKRAVDTINFLFVKAAINKIKKGPYSFEYLTNKDVREI
jgi:hypothetical protein